MTVRKKRKSFKFKFSILIVLLSVLLYLDSRYVRINRVKIHDFTISDKDIPEDFNGTKILVFSDITSNTNQMDKLIKKSKTEKPDFIVFLGNLSIDDQTPLMSEKLKELDAPLGKFATLSENDYKDNIERTKEVLEFSDFRTQNSNVIPVYNKTNKAIQFGFIDGSDNSPSAIDLVNSGLKEDKFTLVFSYDYDKNIVSDALISSKYGYSKVNIPYLSNIFYGDYPLKTKQTIDKQPVYLTNGLSTPDNNFRLFSTPDALLITLKSSD